MFYILMIDDEPKQLQAHQFFLKTHDCLTDLVSTATEALDLLSKNIYDLILLDAKMPDTDGYLLCSKIKSLTKTPIIFLSNYSQEQDQLLGFYHGGSDYISKDTSLELFWARVSACLIPKDSLDAVLQFPPLVLDRKRQRAFIDHTDLLLTQTEFLLLACLASVPGKIWSVQSLYREIWGDQGEINPVLVQVHISRMRNKLEKAFPRHDFIETAWGKGYLFIPIDEINE